VLISDGARRVIAALEAAGHEAYAVGGCVRDSLLGQTPKDWDICTNAPPSRVAAVFAGEKVINTGAKHGSVTVMLGAQPYEVTAFRIDGAYGDGRRPDSVAFGCSLREDLARRDFTCNAIAYNPSSGFTDPFGGAGDIKRKLLRCVGDPDCRFREDSLRILRALRFAATLGFAIAPDTALAMERCCGLAGNIARERVSTELNGLVMGEGLTELLTRHKRIMFEIIPPLSPADGFEQRNPYHIYDVYTHLLVSADAAPKDLTVRLTMLLHDIGKPACYTADENGRGHFHGHGAVGADMARDILRGLKYDNAAIKAICELILHHDAKINADAASVRRWLNKLGARRMRQLTAVRRADRMAQSALAREELPQVDALAQAIDNALAEGQCFSLKSLAVNGRDLEGIGIQPGKRMGEILTELLQKVMDGELPNEREALLAFAATRRSAGRQ
jgi:tRNA nucleotidyltransferase (CCA-adding enzyme)